MASSPFKKIPLNQVKTGNAFAHANLDYVVIESRLGASHYSSPAEWKTTGPVKLWCYELPWGHRVVFEFSIDESRVRLFVSKWEIKAILKYFRMEEFGFELDAQKMSVAESQWLGYSEGVGRFGLFRQDDNSNTLLINEYETRRVAEYYQGVFEARGHKQIYWVEDLSGSKYKFAG